MRTFLERWDADTIDGAALLRALEHAFPASSNAERQAALETVAHGPASPASACAAAALCELAGLGDPLEVAATMYRSSDSELAEPVWFLWIAGYSYNWICNSGLSACYFGFGEKQFADRIRVYDAIEADTAAAVLREADQAFGDGGPPADLPGRQARISDALYDRLRVLSPRFEACGDEIFTRAFLYARKHGEHLETR